MSKTESSHATFGMTLRVRDTCLCLHTQRASRAIARRFDDALRDLDLRHGQFSLLISLNRPEPPTLGSVARLLAMDRTTLTANLKPLERRGLIRIQADDTDRRARRLTLTDDGLALLERAVPLWIETHEEIERVLDFDGDALRGALDGLARAVGREDT